MTKGGTIDIYENENTSDIDCKGDQSPDLKSSNLQSVFNSGFKTGGFKEGAEGDAYFAYELMPGDFSDR